MVLSTVLSSLKGLVKILIQAKLAKSVRSILFNGLFLSTLSPEAFLDDYQQTSLDCKNNLFNTEQLHISMLTAYYKTDASIFKQYDGFLPFLPIPLQDTIPALIMMFSGYFFLRSTNPLITTKYIRFGKRKKNTKKTSSAT